MLKLVLSLKIEKSPATKILVSSAHFLHILSNSVLTQFFQKTYCDQLLLPSPSGALPWVLVHTILGRFKLHPFLIKSVRVGLHLC